MGARVFKACNKFYFPMYYINTDMYPNLLRKLIICPVDFLIKSSQ